MERRQVSTAVRWMVLLCVLAVGWTAARAGEASLEQGFLTPPDSAKPWAYWWWLDGNATKDGITRDLEAMQRQGIAGALVFDAGEGGPLAPKGPPFMSEPWRELFKFAVAEAHRLGLQLSINLCSGWNAGGSWVTPEQAAKKLVCSQLRLTGPAQVSQPLPQPPSTNYYEDVAVLAYKLAGDAGTVPLRLTASSSFPQYPPELAQDGDPQTRWISNGSKPGQGPRPERPEFYGWEYAVPFPAAALYIQPYSDCGPRDCELQSSADGEKFESVARFVVDDKQAKTVRFDEVRAKFFRLVITSCYPFQGQECWNVQVSELALLKAGQTAENLPRWRCLSHAMVDLSANVDAAGLLTWQAPEGDWQILRIGATLVAGATKCVSPGSAGLEIDPLSAAAMDQHFAATGEKLITDAGDLAGKTLTYTHIDSWEIAEQPNWSPGLRAEFQRRYGYDLLPFLPALVGGSVDGAETSERFRWDYRRMVADLVADNYYGRLGELSHRRGLGIHPESGGPFVGWHDELQNEGRNDIPMGEFWYPSGLHADFSLKQAACAAHTYGKRLCQAEAYTDMGPNWEESPRLLKTCGDRAFCQGLTRTMLCFYVHQPDQNAQPGYQWEAAGTHFDRHVTWWPKIQAWLTYHARCQHLLQQGLFVADVCYFCGQDVPASVPYRNQMNPPLPAGYDYDVCNTEVLLGRTEVREGRIVLPDGMSYRLLILPQRETMSPEVLQKIAALVEAGATVVGPKPKRAPGLKDFPRCDQAVQTLAAEVWGAGEGTSSSEHAYGRGKVIGGAALQPVLLAAGLSPDFEGESLEYIHRQDAATDIYFVCNPSDRAVSSDCTFRVGGKQPELWDPVTGSVRAAAAFRQREGRTTIPLEFASHGSLFVVFRRPLPADGRGPAEGNFPRCATALELAGPWRVEFDPQWGGPQAAEFARLESWSERPEEGIRYYSGTAKYVKSFVVPANVVAPGHRVHLDLGVVRELAEIRLNGKDLGVVWTNPFRVDITAAVQAGDNCLEIEVVNLWPNRLIGDGRLPPEKRLTKTNVQKFFVPPQGGEHKLLASGLLGPVVVQVAEGTN